MFHRLGRFAAIRALLTSSLVNNYNQAEIDLFYDATSKLMLRGGYRYVWGDAERRGSSRRGTGQLRPGANSGATSAWAA